MLYQFPDSEGGMLRPGIITHVWGDQPTSAVQLQVFVDTDAQGKYNDGRNQAINGPLVWKTSVSRGFGASQYHFHDDPDPLP